MRPNILLITADQMRGDCIAALGHPEVLTSNLDTMIRSGTAFVNAYSAVPTCIPARAALFTGLSQESHRRVGYQDGIAWDYPYTLPGILAGAGYHTHCAGKMHVHPPRALMGFHSVDLHDSFLPYRDTGTPASGWQGRIDDYLYWLRSRAGPDADIGDCGLGCNSWAARPWPLAEELHPTNWIAGRAADFLRRRDPTKPFFLWTSFVAPHPPLFPPDCWFQEYLNRELSPSCVGEWAEAVGETHPVADCFEGRPSAREIHRMQAGYYGLVSHLDAQIGRLFRILRDEGALENTVLLFCSDHGEMLGDHHMFRKSQPYQGSVRIPMILYNPGDCLHLPNDVKCGTIAELRDVLPTLLDAAGTPCPESCEGISLLPVLRGERPGRELLHGEHTCQQGTGGSTHFLVSREWKYIWVSSDGRELLFHLSTDAQELHDLSALPTFSGTLLRMRSELAHVLAGRPEGYSNGETLFIGRKAVNILPGNERGGQSC